MNKISRHADLVALTQMPPSVLSPEDVAELQKQLRIRLDREMEQARDEAVRDLLDMEDYTVLRPAAKAVVAAYWREGGDPKEFEEAEGAYFIEHPEVLELYLPKHLGEKHLGD